MSNSSCCRRNSSVNLSKISQTLWLGIVLTIPMGFLFFLNSTRFILFQEYNRSVSSGFFFGKFSNSFFKYSSIIYWGISPGKIFSSFYDIFKKNTHLFSGFSSLLFMYFSFFLSAVINLVINLGISMTYVLRITLTMLNRDYLLFFFRYSSSLLTSVIN